MPTPLGCLEGIWEGLRSKRVPENASKLIISSWWDKININYNSAWRMWDAWCAKRKLPPFRQMYQFLADEFEAGRQCRSLNCYRSALSSTLLPIEGLPVGQHFQWFSSFLHVVRHVSTLPRKGPKHGIFAWN